MTTPLVDTNWPAPVDPPPVVFASAPTLAEQVGALVARWLAGPPSGLGPNFHGAWFASIRAEHRRLDALASETDDDGRAKRILSTLRCDLAIADY